MAETAGSGELIIEIQFFPDWATYAVMAVILLLALTNKKALLCLLIPFVPLHNIVERFPTVVAGLGLINFSILVLAVFFLPDMAGRFRYLMEKPNRQLVITVLIFVLVTTVSLLWATRYVGFDITWKGKDIAFKNLLIPIMFFFIVSSAGFSRKGIIGFIIMMALILPYMVYVHLEQILSFSLLEYSSELRVTGTLTNLGSNELAAFYCHAAMFILGFALLYRESRGLRIYLIIMFLAAVIGVIFSYSRGAYLAVFTAILFLAIRKKRALSLLLILFIAVGPLIVPESVKKRIGMTKSETGELDRSSASRFYLATIAIQLFKESPLLGKGFGNYSMYSWRKLDTHNQYLNFLAEMGLPGFILFILIFYYGYRVGSGLLQSPDVFFQAVGLGVIGCVVGSAIVNLFGDRFTYIEIGTYLWTFMGIGVNCHVLKMKRAEGENLAT